MNLYPYFKQVLLDAGATDHVDLNTDTIKVMLVDGYTYDSTDKYVTDIGTGTILARSGALQSPTIVNGTFDANDITVTGEGSGGHVTDIIIYKDTGSDATSVLIGNIDQDGSAAALNLPTNGSGITVTFNGSGIFSL